MKRLFEVVLRDGSFMIPRAFFEAKKPAKTLRDQLNHDRKGEKMFIGFKVALGPDHRLFGVKPRPGTTNSNGKIKKK